MFDGITEANLQKKMMLGQMYEFTVIEAVATYDQEMKAWKVKLKIKEGKEEKEIYIDEKRGETKSYSSLDRITARLSKYGLKELIVDLSSLI